MKDNSLIGDTLTDDATLLALVENAGLMKSWHCWPDEVREAAALAATYSRLLAEDPGAEVAPWIFPEVKELL